MIHQSINDITVQLKTENTTLQNVAVERIVNRNRTTKVVVTTEGTEIPVTINWNNCQQSTEAFIPIVLQCSRFQVLDHTGELQSLRCLQIPRWEPRI